MSLTYRACWLALAGCGWLTQHISAAPRTIHVAPQGSDKAAGSAAEPLRTLKEALARAETGDTVRLVAGAYAGKVAARLSRRTVVVRSKTARHGGP